MAADGWSNRDIGEAVGLHYNQVGLWRKRYEEFGLVGWSGAGELRKGRRGQRHDLDEGDPGGNAGTSLSCWSDRSLHLG
ncbi:MAG: helix-turn-helix domain-containing protein [Acidimicrobiales bacterium]